MEGLGHARSRERGAAASFGGRVALAYATRHPAYPPKLIPISTEARGGPYRDRRVALFEGFGNPEVGALVRQTRRQEPQLQHAPRPATHQCPTLVLGGEDDPMHPIESQADIVAALPSHLVQFERFANCRHATMPDPPERTTAVIRDFIARDRLVL